MPEALADFLEVCWLIIIIIWHAVTWFFHAEERLLIEFNKWGWPLWQQIPIISLVNATIIAAEIFLYVNLVNIVRFFKRLFFYLKRFLGHRIRRFVKNNLGNNKKKIKRPKGHRTARILYFISRGKPIGYTELALLTLIPECQKAASFVYTVQRDKFGWRGYVALCVGGTIRLVLISLLPMNLIWVVIVAMIVYRLATWWFENNYKEQPIRENEEE